MRQRASIEQRAIMADNPQKAHYEAIHDEYERHYFDPTSLEYRRRFILKRLIGADSLAGKKVADMACGSGYNSLLLQEVFPSAKVEGFDISASACSAYISTVGAPAHEVDLTKPLGIEDIFDAAIVIGGLHHCIENLDQAFENLRNILRPGGRLYVIEPNAAFILQNIRSAWYKKDQYFDSDTEEALDLGQLKLKAVGFSHDRSFYFGGPAYFIILNSLVTRVPISVKSALARPLFMIEAGWNRMAPNRFLAAFGAVWIRQ
jgi:SAM-dependent methyltransferase